MSIRSSAQKSESRKKTHLTDYMKKLTNHLLQDSSLQLQVFQSLNVNDLQMLFESLIDDNLVLRKTAAKFICYLIYQNQKIQKLLLDKEKVCLTTGNFIIGGIPAKVTPKNYPKILTIVNTMPIRPSQQPTLCWLVNIETYECNWRYWKDSEDFFDPATNVFGIHIGSKGSLQKISPLKPNVETPVSKVESSHRIAKKPVAKTGTFK